MKLISTRDVFLPGATLATLMIDGEPFGFVCEDFDRGLNSTDSLEHIRAVKIPGETAIPAGTYRVGLRNSPKHGPNTLYLQDVPGSEYIDIHAGNTAAHTKGCQLVGERRDVRAGTISESRACLARLRNRVVPAVQRGDVVTWEIVRQ